MVGFLCQPAGFHVLLQSSARGRLLARPSSLAWFWARSQEIQRYMHLTVRLFSVLHARSGSIRVEGISSQVEVSRHWIRIQVCIQDPEAG